MAAVELPLSCVRDIRRLTILNVVANGLILYGLVVVVALAIQALADGDPGSRHRWHDLSPVEKDWPYMTGTSVRPRYRQLCLARPTALGSS
jgi:hypothetical protein